jgi:hypothetical protein
MTWRSFWHAWAHLHLKRERERREAGAFQIYVAYIQSAPQHAEKVSRELEESNEEADRESLKRLADELPWSVRPLFVPIRRGSGDPIADHNAAVLEWWDYQIEQTEPGSPTRAFLQAGKRSALKRIDEYHQARPN